MRFSHFFSAVIVGVLAVQALPVLAAPYRSQDGSGYDVSGQQYHYEVWQHGNSDYELKVWTVENYPKGPQVNLRSSRFDSSARALKFFDCSFTERKKDQRYCSSI